MTSILKRKREQIHRYEERGRDYSNKSVSYRIPRITVSHGAKKQAWNEFFFRASRRTNAASILISDFWPPERINF